MGRLLHYHRCEHCKTRIPCDAPFNSDSIDSDGPHCTADPQDGGLLCEECSGEEEARMRAERASEDAAEAEGAR